VELLVPHGVGVARRLTQPLVVRFTSLQVAVDLLAVCEVKGQGAVDCSKVSSGNDWAIASAVWPFRYA
jgi:hypothetical protein